MRDDIEVSTGDVCGDAGMPTGRKQAVIVDRPAGRAWSHEADTTNDAVTGAMRKFLGDRRSREYVG